MPPTASGRRPPPGRGQSAHPDRTSTSSQDPADRGLPTGVLFVSAGTDSALASLPHPGITSGQTTTPLINMSRTPSSGWGHPREIIHRMDKSGSGDAGSKIRSESSKASVWGGTFGWSETGTSSPPKTTGASATISHTRWVPPCPLLPVPPRPKEQTAGMIVCRRCPKIDIPPTLNCG